MTRKDFQLIADVLNNYNKPGVGCVQSNLVEALALSFAHELAKTNPRLNKERFVKACLKA